MPFNVLQSKRQTKAGIDDGIALTAEFRRMNTDNLANFPIAGFYEGKKTVCLAMDEAAFIKPNGKTDGLYTEGAFDCAIVIAIARGPISGKIENIGMLHVSRYATNGANLDGFFKKLQNGKPADIEISVISGTEWIAEQVMKASKKAGKIVFMNCDAVEDGGKQAIRNDAAVVDKNGKIYYGEILDRLLKDADLPNYRKYGKNMLTHPLGGIKYREAR